MKAVYSDSHFIEMLFYYACSEDDACLFMCKQFILDKAKFKFYTWLIYFMDFQLYIHKYAEAEMFKDNMRDIIDIVQWYEILLFLILWR